MIEADWTSVVKDSTFFQVRDTLPYIMVIMQPGLRPVNTQLYSPREKEELHNLVNLHIAFNLNYVQEKTPEGSYIYR